MPSSLLATKFYIPLARPDCVARKRLIGELDQGLFQEGGFARKLTLVSAPAGFGKTTLLSDFLSRTKRLVVWVTLEAQDNQLARFITCLIAALQKLQSGLGASAQNALAQLPFGAELTPVWDLLTHLLNDISHLPQPFFLVLDDYHLITEQSIHDALTYVIENQPRNMHIVVSGRSDPPWPMARLRSRREVKEIRASDLRFTVEEAALFFNKAMNLDLSTDHVSALAERTEGWIAGLQMAAISMQAREDIPSFIAAFTGSHRFIFDYLVEEVLTRQSPEIEEFLLKTSLLDRMTAPLCDAVTGRKDSHNLLPRLEQANLFLVPLDDERRWYRYHHLFAELLRNQLKNAYPDDLTHLHRRASIWFEANHYIEEAIAHAFVGQDPERAADLIEHYAQEMDLQSRQVTLAAWIEALPSELVRERPWLCVYHARALHWMGKRERVEECLQIAERFLTAPPQAVVDGSSTHNPISGSEREKLHLSGHIAAIRAHNALTDGDIPRVLQWGHRALELLPEGDDLRTTTAVSLGGAYWALGDAVASQHNFDMARKNALTSGYRILAVPSTCYMGIQMEKQGQLREALNAYSDALDLATGADGKQNPVAGFPNVKLGQLAREWDDLETARRHLVLGVDQLLQLGQADVLADGLVGLARLQLAERTIEAAFQTIKKADSFAQTTKIDPFVVCWLDDCRVRLWLAQGDLPAAMNWIRDSGLKPDGELSYHYDLNHRILARVLVARGIKQREKDVLDTGLQLLARLSAAAEKAGWVKEQIEILVLLALACRVSGEHQRSLSYLTRALSLAQPGGFVRVFIEEGSLLKELLLHAKANGISVDYVNKLLHHLEYELTPEKRRLVPGPLQTPERLVDPLSDRELEILRFLETSLTSTEIAAELYISVGTVRTHIKNIYRKLDVNRRMEAIQRAEELGLI